jgi:2-C-methyl-D-erythritol 2,4-cyclodiphosphate synthase
MASSAPLSLCPSVGFCLTLGFNAHMPERADTAPPFRIGHGYDIHRLEPMRPAGPGRPLILAGVRLEHSMGPVSHSDGDAVLHAVTDAILGALGEPDIGQLFPDDDPRHESADSSIFVKEAMRRLAARGYALGNLDITIICQSPKISPHKAAMIASIARLLGCEPSQINLKGKTHEHVDAVGEGRAIEAHALALLLKR